MKSLSQITSRYIGKSFEEVPCINLIYQIYTDINIDVPDRFEGVALKDAITYWEQRPKLAIVKMLRLFKTLGKPVEGSLKIYDLLVIKVKGENVFPAIYVGKNQFITSMGDIGVAVFGLSSIFTIIMKRRLL